MKNKESQFWTLGKLVLIVFVVLLLATIGSRLLGKSSAQASDFLDAPGDCDRDQVSNYFDKCDCLPGDEKNEGCPVGSDKSGKDAELREQKCKEECNKKFSDNK